MKRVYHNKINSIADKCIQALIGLNSLLVRTPVTFAEISSRLNTFVFAKFKIILGHIKTIIHRYEILI